ncbi:hypothetical protein [Chryseobacterium sp. MFBS3-17]|uniref:hypothetical protein n=1 Tax=Chryseobacterium sp. MFBS3-17 TaxID=2886689 RepID=UPI001D0E2A74|nr:hypothetical protein [Chryseobacterium sp. MFBS3-17]MCC2590435.1 hypothetical protein [Chryseobacterium sp. MFBS3-17]
MNFHRYLSTFTFLYILFIATLNYFEIIIPGRVGVIFQVFHEILMLPLLLSVPVQTIIYGIRWKKAHFSGDSPYRYSFFMITAALALAVGLTVKDFM